MPRVLKIDVAHFIGTSAQIRKMLRELMGDGSATVKIGKATFEYKENDDGQGHDQTVNPRV